ncbi:MAG: alpha/beta hydrolase [Clostridiales bacterium]|nr:alpha/beta hydrolase [Clostridiales bacterium]
METTVDGVQCEYEMCRAHDDTNTVVLFLHGWGGGLSSFAGAYKAASDWGVNCVNFAFPKKVPSSWGVYEYAACVRDFMLEQGIEKPIIVGHSFGGRVAIILAAQGLAQKIMLVDSAGLKPKFSLKKKIRIARYHHRVKRGKSLDGFGSTDYNKVDTDMRGVFVRIVNTHLDRLLPYIKCQTLIFWGKRDRDTPPYMAKRLLRGIENSSLIMTDGGHYSYIDCKYKFTLQLKNFVTE